MQHFAGGRGGSGSTGGGYPDVVVGDGTDAYVFAGPGPDRK